MSLDAYLERRGGQGLSGARHVGPTETIAEITAAGLRGRGGAGFPTGTKWRSVAEGVGRHRYAVCNAAEGEPGTFKDRALLRANPYAVIEGLLIAAEAVGAREAYLAMKASFVAEQASVRRAIGEIEAAGWLRDVTITIVTGPEEYLFGEEKALLEVIEGNEPLPRLAAAVPARPVRHGAAARLAGARGGGGSRGSPRIEPDPGQQRRDPRPGGVDPRPRGRCVPRCRHDGIARHGAVHDRRRRRATRRWSRCRWGRPCGRSSSSCGGPLPGRSVKAVFPGVANAVLTSADLDTPLSYEAMEAIGSGLGAGGFIVYDDSACMVEVAAVMSRFLYVESCGQCPPCKLGTGEITAVLERIRTGQGEDADLGRIAERLRIVADGNRCYLPVQERIMISSILRGFPEDVAAHLEGYCRSERQQIPTPKITDLVDGVVTYDERQERKRPDWTYAD